MDAEKLSGMSTEELAAARESASDDEKKLIDDEMAKRQAEEKPAEKAGDPAEDASQLPYGSQVLAAAFEALTTATADIKQAVGMVEQPDAKATLDMLIETLEGSRTSLSAAYASIYPDAPSLEAAEEQVEATADENVLKSFVAMGRDRQARGMGIVGRLRSAINLNPIVAAAAAPALKSLSSMISEAKSKAIDLSGPIKEFEKLNALVK